MTRLLLLGALVAAPAFAQTPRLVHSGETAAPPFAAAGGVVYQLDDGSASQAIGPPSTFDPDMLWGNYFLTQPDGETITEMSVLFEAAPDPGTGDDPFPSRGNPITLWLLSDADGDLDPRNAVPVASATLAEPVTDDERFYTVQIPPTAVGAGFFVGVSVQLLGGEDNPAALDPQGTSGRSWVFYDGDIAAVIDDLASAAYGVRVDGAFPGAFMVRAVGEPTPVAGEAGPGGGATLFAPAPNPSRGTARLAFSLARAATVRLDVVDALGRTVAVLAEGERAPGLHREAASGLAAGVYVVRLAADGAVATRTVTVGR